MKTNFKPKLITCLVLSILFLNPNETKSQCSPPTCPPTLVPQINGPISACTDPALYQFTANYVSACDGCYQWTVNGGTIINYPGGNNDDVEVSWNSGGGSITITVLGTDIQVTMYIQKCCEPPSGSYHFVDADISALSVMPQTQVLGPVYVVTSATFYLDGAFDIPVGNSLYLINCNVFMGAGAIIKNNGGGTINQIYISSNTIIEAYCEVMWQGIHLAHDAVITVENSTIRDAQYAIKINQKCVLVSTYSAYERNFVSIYMPPDALSNYFQGGTDFEGNIFSGSAPLFDDFNSQSPATQNHRAWGGLLLYNCDIFETSNNAAAAPNVFENLNAGIVCINSNAEVYHC